MQGIAGEGRDFPFCLGFCLNQNLEVVTMHAWQATQHMHEVGDGIYIGRTS